MRKAERKCPLGWYTDVDVDDTSIEVRYNYWAHNRTDEDRRPLVHKMSFQFAKQDIINLIPEEACKSSFYLVNFARVLDDRRWDMIEYISDTLCDDFENTPVKIRSMSGMYKGILRTFAEDKKYQMPLGILAKYEALLSLLKKPKTFHGHDIRTAM